MYSQNIKVEQKRVPKGSVNLSHKSSTGDLPPPNRRLRLTNYWAVKVHANTANASGKAKPVVEFNLAQCQCCPPP